MKSFKYITSIFVWLYFITQVGATTPTDLQKWISQGNSFYEKDQYEQAVEAYQKAITPEFQSAEVYFNLGNAYYKLRQIAPAVYNYEMALLLKPNDSEILTNLKYAQRMTLDDIKEVPKVGFSEMIKSFVTTLHYDAWAWLGVGSFFVMLLSFMGYYFGSTTAQKRMFFIFIFIAIGAGLISIASGFKHKAIIENQVYAVVFADEVRVNSEPKSNAEEAFTLHEGTKVLVIDSNHTWSKIQIQDGKQGWILDKDIKKLKL